MNSNGPTCTEHSAQRLAIVLVKLCSTVKSAHCATLYYTVNIDGPIGPSTYAVQHPLCKLLFCTYVAHWSSVLLHRTDVAHWCSALRKWIICFLFMWVQLTFIHLHSAVALLSSSYHRRGRWFFNKSNQIISLECSSFKLPTHHHLVVDVIALISLSLL